MKLTISGLIFCFLSLTATGQIQKGMASYYADKFEGHPTASGEKYKHNKLTAAHRTLPFGTVVKVTNQENQKSVEVTINDRGPYVDGRVIDLSKRAAEELDFVLKGLAEVTVEVVDAGDGKSSGFPKTVNNVSVDEKEFYTVQSERIDPSGIGVQIGTYQELANLMRISDNLKASYKKEVTIQVKVIQGVKVYSIIIGNFKNRMKAEQFLGNVKKRYPDSFIVDFDRL